MKFDDVIRHKLANITIEPPHIEEIIITTDDHSVTDDISHVPTITKIVVPTTQDKNSLLQALHFLYTNNVHAHYSALESIIDLLQDSSKIEVEDEDDSDEDDSDKEDISYSDELMGDLKALEGDDDDSDDDDDDSDDNDDDDE